MSRDFSEVLTVKRDFKGIWISREIYLLEDLSWMQKILLVEIDSLDSDPEKGCYASNEYFAKFLGTSESTAANEISKLKSAGFVEQIWFDGRTRGLRTSFSRFHQTSHPGFTKQVKQLSPPGEDINKDLDLRSKDLDLISRSINKDSLDKSKLVELPKKEQQLNLAVNEVFEEWKRVFNHPKSILTADKRKRIQSRLKDGFTPKQLSAAVAGAKLSPFHMGENPTGTIYDKIDTIFKNGGQVEKFIDILETSNSPAKKAPILKQSECLNCKGYAEEGRRPCHLHQKELYEQYKITNKGKSNNNETERTKNL